MRPPQKRLQSAESPVGRVDVRLVDEMQLAARQSSRQRVRQAGLVLSEVQLARQRYNQRQLRRRTLVPAQSRR
jgi:hypothetical protein